MRKNQNNFLAAVFCIAGLSACMLNEAKAENVEFSSAGSSLMQSESLNNLPASGVLANTPVASPLINSTDAGLTAALKGYQFNNSLNLPSSPTYSLPVGVITGNVAIPEPSSTACFLLGLGVLVGIRYLKRDAKV